jgi:hypothetical protein
MTEHKHEIIHSTVHCLIQLDTNSGSCSSYHWETACVANAVAVDHRKEMFGRDACLRTGLRHHIKQLADLLSSYSSSCLLCRPGMQLDSAHQDGPNKHRARRTIRLSGPVSSAANWASIREAADLSATSLQLPPIHACAVQHWRVSQTPEPHCEIVECLYVLC